MIVRIYVCYMISTYIHTIHIHRLSPARIVGVLCGKEGFNDSHSCVDLRPLKYIECALYVCKLGQALFLRPLATPLEPPTDVSPPDVARRYTSGRVKLTSKQSYDILVSTASYETHTKTNTGRSTFFGIRALRSAYQAIALLHKYCTLPHML